MYSWVIAYLHNVYGAVLGGVRIKRKPLENEHVYLFMVMITGDYAFIEEIFISEINYDAIFIMTSELLPFPFNSMRSIRLKYIVLMSYYKLLIKQLTCRANEIIQLLVRFRFKMCFVLCLFMLFTN